MRLDRTNTSLFGRWWWTVDRVTLVALVGLIAIGAVMVAAASPPVAQHLGLPMFYFVQRHHVFLVIALIVMITVSLLTPLWVRRVGVIGYGVSIMLMIAVLFIGVETKGAHRWLQLGGISLQPSELMKPCFAIVMAWICAEKHRRVDFPGNKIAIALFGLSAGLLLLQPDLGMTITVTAMWATQFFLAGLSFVWVMLLGLVGATGLVAAYFIFPHVSRRIDVFLDPTSGDNYQVRRSLEAFEKGGALGRGPGEGTVKRSLPDSHTDFVFSVAGEEFGMIFCAIIVTLFAIVVLRSFFRVWKESDLFIVLAVAGIAVQFGVQAIINMGVAVSLLPAKGMTLPFLSYGGSSVLAVGLGMGMLLALTRQRYGSGRRR